MSMLAVPLTRALELRDYISQRHIEYDQRDPNLCVLGLAQKKFGNVCGIDVYDEKACAEFLGITYKQALDIAYPGRSNQGIYCKHIGSNKLWACEMLTHLALTGEVDWAGTEPRDA